MTFINKILPTEGLYCVAKAYPNGGFRHYFCETVEEAQAQIDLLDSQGHTVFLAQATFKTSDSRKQSNAVFLRNFFFDIDCGAGKDYACKEEAVAALKLFVQETALPFPSVVSSGNGFYAHWAFEKNIPAQQWKTIARVLKATASAYGFRTDPARTSDSASVLRPPGATHRKDPQNLKTVTILKDSQPLDFMAFVQILARAAKKKKVDTSPTQAPKTSKDINSEFYDGIETSIPSSVISVADKCQQLAQFRDTKGAVSEPLWYAALGVMVFCEDGEGLVQEWSSGHQDYSVGATNAKADQYLSSGAGPSTCSQFGSINPEACIGCPHNGKIKSPIVLGRPEPVAIKEVDAKGKEVEADMPKGYRRTKEGLFYEEEGRWFRFYDQDLKVDKIAFDESLGYQIASIKHTLPHDGEMEFSVRSSLVHDTKGIMVFLSDNNVHVMGTKEKKVMALYIEAHISKLQRQQKMSMLMNQMGWKKTGTKNPLFVLGGKIFHSDGSVDTASLAKNVPTAALGYRSEGDLNTWIDATRLLGRPGMEAHAFMLLCGFAAPLMKFTGFDGAMVSAVGDSGAGKTLMLRLVQSIYGYHKDLIMLRDDTRNVLLARLGVYGNLPLAIDEITNIDGKDLSDIVYRVTQGRDKARLTKESVERSTLNSWNTLALVSTNSSLVDKLSGVKHDASAEINRLFEFRVDEVAGFSGETTSDLWWTLDTNFGYAGERYIGWLAQNFSKVTPGLAAIQAKIDEAAGIKGDERYWSAIAATAVYGGMVAKSLGLVKFDIAPIMSWAIKTIKDMRGEKEDLASGAFAILGQFLDEHANNRLIVSGSSVGGKMCSLLQEPRGQLVIRSEVDKHRAYVSRSSFKAWISRRFGAYSKVAAELRACGALLNPNKQKVLGGGTSYSGAPQPCWELDMTHPELSEIACKVVKPSVDNVTVGEARR